VEVLALGIACSSHLQILDSLLQIVYRTMAETFRFDIDHGANIGMNRELVLHRLEEDDHLDEHQTQT
jgi:hypothetical protein